MAKSFYDRFDGCEQERCFGRKDVVTKEGTIDPDIVKIRPIDEKNLHGNPRLWNQVQQLKKQGKIKGIVDEAVQVRIVTDKELGGKIYKSMQLLIDGLEFSGQPADPIVLDSEGYAIEGFRRTVASRILKGRGDKRFDRIPCIVLPQGVSEEAQLEYLGVTHVSSKVPWESANRAAAAAKLRDDFGWEPTKIGRLYGWRKSKVDRYLLTHDLLKEYQHDKGDFRPDRFTMFYKVASNGRLLAMMKDASDAEYEDDLWEQFETWVKNDKINDCRDVAAFTSTKVNILKYPAARTKVSKEGTTAAIEWVRRNQGRVKAVEMMDDLCQEIAKMPNKRRAELATDSPVAKEARLTIEKTILALEQFKVSIAPPDSKVA